MSLFDGVLPPYRDAELVVVRAIQAWFSVNYAAPVKVGTLTLPGERFESSLPFIRVGRVGGAPIDNSDRPVIDVDVLAETRDQAYTIAQLVMQLMMSAPHPIDDCRVLMAPQRVEWVEGSTVRRFYASYQLGLRR